MTTLLRVPSAGQPARLSACVHAAFGGQPVSLRNTTEPTRECHYRARPCSSVGEDDIKVLRCGPSAYENTCHYCPVRY